MLSGEKYIKDGNDTGYVQITLIDGERAWGRYYQRRMGEFIQIDSEDKFWIVKMHSWKPAFIN